MEKIISFTDWHTYDPRTVPGVPVIIVKDIRLGIDVTVMMNATNGENILVASGSLLTKSLASNVVSSIIRPETLNQIDTGKSGFNQ